MPPIRVALDWTPNINHAGFFVALERGYFADRGVDVTFESPHSDGYSSTPAAKLAAGKVDIAICPSESIISYACQAHQERKPNLKLTAVAAVLANDTSAIVTLKSSGIGRPKELDGKRYASYAARYEGRIVQQLIRNDGGAGEYTEDTNLEALGIMKGLLEGQADATWVFMGWEGVLARRQGVDLNAFSLDEYKVPYGYTPVVTARSRAVDSPHERVVLRRFLEAAELGWNAVVAEPARAAHEAVAAIERVWSDLPEPVDGETMAAAAEYVAAHVTAEGSTWGHMEEGRWADFVDWLSTAGLLTSKRQSRTPSSEMSASLDELRNGDAGDAIPREAIPADSLFTNRLLPHELKPSATLFASKPSTDGALQNSGAEQHA